MNKKVIAICAAVMALAGCNGNSKIEDAVRAKLKVPASAKFDKIVKIESRACAVFKAKNLLGVYTGKSTAQLVNIGAGTGKENWMVEGIDDSMCSDALLKQKLAVDHADVASDAAVLKALKDGKLVPASTTDLYNSLTDGGKCSTFVTEVIGNGHQADAALDPEEKAGYEKKYNEGLAQLKQGMCRYKNGAWGVDIEKSKIDDSENVYLSLSASDAVTSDGETVTPTLLLRCSQGKTEAFINWDLYLGMDQTDVLTRLDKDKAQTGSWSLSTDNKATFVPGDVEAFAKQLLAHKQLLVQVTPYSESPVTVSFPLVGLDNAIKPLSKACHW